MNTEKRLSYVLEHSDTLYYEDHPRIVLFSDCHRGDGSWSDNFLKNQNLYFAALEYYYENAFTYIELGDGDELWENRNMGQIIQVHSNSFWMLSRFYQKGKLYLLYGNHDMSKKNAGFSAKNYSSYYSESLRQELPLFPGITASEGLILSERSGKNRILLAHGHQGDLINDTLWKLSRFLVRYLWKPLELLGFLDPTSTAKNYRKKDHIEEKLSGWAAKKQHLLICGHTHRPRLPQPDEAPYFNTGSCVHPRCITCIEITEGSVCLVKWTEFTDERRYLYVDRQILAGPVTLASYELKNK